VITLTDGCKNQGQTFGKLPKETNFNMKRSNLKEMNNVKIKE
jgi:hypothetical protein